MKRTKIRSLAAAAALLFTVTACPPNGSGGETETDGTSSSTTGSSDGTSTITGDIGTSTTGEIDSTDTGIGPATGTSTSTTDNTGSTSVDPTTTSEPPPGVCGDGTVDDDEECDDGNNESYDDCTNACESARCGDGIVHKGVEECDDGNDNNTDDCTTKCKDPECGDGHIQGDEECDDGNDVNEDLCTAECKVNVCGDGLVELETGTEVCDNGNNRGNYGGCMPNCKAFGPHCGDKIVQKWEGERCDGDLDLVDVSCNDFCSYDFANATQLYCAASCSWDDEYGCQKGDADIFCQLKLGSPTATALSFEIGDPTNAPGFPCGNPNVWYKDDARIDLGKLPEYGVNAPVLWQNGGILKDHGNGETIRNITCID